ncbi:MAG TPA: PAS domain-containing protein, partial [Bryobacteraceae bacterium]|nr:PAS domain-containing protein [Bryobacteraceae bacterium]
MNPLKRSPLHSSVFALTATAIALVLSLLFGPWLQADAFLPFLAAVWASSWYHEWVGGLLATGASAAAILFFFLRSDLSSDASWIGFCTFLILALLITWLTSSWRQNRRLLASTLSSIGDAVLVTDPHGRITFLNAVAETLTGWPYAEARGKPVGEVLQLIDEKSRGAVDNPLTKALRERITVTMHDETVLVSRSGAEVPVEHSAAPVREESGEIRGGILVFRDISKRRHLEEQVTH